MKYFFHFAALLLPAALSAQTNISSVVNTCGGNSVPATIHLEWSVGEMVSIDLMNSSNIQLSNGLLQGNLQLTTAIPFYTISPNELQLYPNPVNHILLSRFQFAKPGVLHIKLTDGSGRNVANWKNTYSSGLQVQPFPVQHLTAGIYLAEIFFIPYNGNPQKGTYTLIKK